MRWHDGRIEANGGMMMEGMEKRKKPRNKHMVLRNHDGQKVCGFKQ